ncbi:hypothetical protein TYRP_018235 [Tyrophagus putrescentiae]|nr:hypothetical protein TYRP_018235 [Tyrophagus putrescentiae]
MGMGGGRSQGKAGTHLLDRSTDSGTVRIIGVSSGGVPVTPAGKRAGVKRPGQRGGQRPKPGE